MDTAMAAFDFIHIQPVGPSPDGLPVADQAAALSCRLDSAERKGQTTEPGIPVVEGSSVHSSPEDAGCAEVDQSTIRAQEVVLSLFPGTYSLGYMDPNCPAHFHWSACVPYSVAAISAVLLYRLV